MPDTPPPYDNWDWHDGAVSTGDVVLVDVDGVIADGNHRQRFLQDGRKEWDNFFNACHDDTPLENEIAMINTLDPATAVFLLTARPHQLRDKTLAWLEPLDLRWDALIMRGKKDGRLSSPQFKQRSVRQVRKQGYNPLVAFDDDMRNVEMFRAEDVPCVYIHSGYYEA